MPRDMLKDHADLATAVDILDAWVAQDMRRKRLPGAALGIVYAGELLWGKGYGVADMARGMPVTLDTRFRIASITKTFTATAILQLRDGGKLRLDDLVSDYLDWFDLRFEDAPEITLRNLLTHTSGLPRDSANPMWTEYEAPDWDRFIAETKARKPTRAPYAAYAYSNLGYSLLGGVIAAVSGLAWADYVAEHVLRPLDMTETMPVPEADDAQLATGYTREKANGREAMPFWVMNAFEASANFASSVNDLVKYAGFHLGMGGADVLSPYSLMDMHRVHWLESSWKGGYGLGMGLNKVNDWVVSGHGGGYPGFLTAFSVCREHQVGVIALTNALGSNPHEIVNQAYKLVLPEIIKAAAAPKPEADPAWQKYVGEYESEWSLSKVVIRDGQLQLLNIEWLDDKPTLLAPTAEAGVFVLRQDGQSNETLRFELDEAGNVVKMWERGEYSRRVN